MEERVNALQAPLPAPSQDELWRRSVARLDEVGERITAAELQRLRLQTVIEEAESRLARLRGQLEASETEIMEALVEHTAALADHRRLQLAAAARGAPPASTGSAGAATNPGAGLGAAAARTGAEDGGQPADDTTACSDSLNDFDPGESGAEALRGWARGRQDLHGHRRQGH